MKSFFAALQFLTIVPVPARWTGGERELARSVVFFPVVGALIGGAAGLLSLGALALFQAPLFSAAATVIAMLVVTGGLHLDGLADTADGFLSARGRDRILEIMKDSRTGAMGAAAIACLIILKIAALSAVPTGLWWQTVTLMAVAGRCAIVMKLAALPYATPQGGLGRVFHEHSTWAHGLWAFVFLTGAGGILLGWPGMIVALIATAATGLFAAYCKGKIGGLTGDTLGATSELVELVPPIVLLACAGRWMAL